MDDSRRCTATAKTTGERCKRAAILGGDVCSMHGGSAPQVEDKAQECLNEIADSMANNAQQNLKDLQDRYEETDDPEEERDILAEMRRYLKIVLDRTNHGPTERREVTGEGGGPVSVAFNEEVHETPWGDDE